MRKTISSVLFILLLFSGCRIGKFEFWSSANKTEEDARSNIVTAEGFIEKEEEQDVLELQQKYVLEDADGKLLYVLESDFEDLSVYVDSGEVEVKGEVISSDENTEAPLLSVHTVQRKEPEEARVFSSSELGISLVLPSEWEYSEAPHRVEFYEAGEPDDPLVILEKIMLESVDGRNIAPEIEEGTEISVGGKRAFRFLRGEEKTDIYVPLDNEFLRFQFLGTAEQKPIFYDLLLSVEFPMQNLGAPPQMCGGIAGLLCPNGYRCELEGTHPDASGICVPVTKEAPQTPPKKQSLPVENSSEEKTPVNGDEEKIPDEPTPPIGPDVLPGTTNVPDEKKTVMEYISKNLNALVPEEAPSGSWQVTSFSFSENSLVAVEYRDESDEPERRKLLFSYDMNEDREVTLEEEAYFTPGEDADWQLESGSNIQRDQSQEIYSPEGEQKAVISEGYRLYESTYHKFSLEYPKNFYYSSSGKTISFSSAPVTTENILLSVQILDGKIEKRIDSPLEVLLPRDDSSHFRLSATQEEYAPALTHMADTLTSKL